MSTHEDGKVDEDEEGQTDYDLRGRFYQLVECYLDDAVENGADGTQLVEIIQQSDLPVAVKLERFRSVWSNTYLEKLEALQNESADEPGMEEPRNDSTSTSTSGIQVVDGRMTVGGKTLATIQRMRQMNKDELDDTKEQPPKAKGRKRKKNDGEDGAQVKKNNNDDVGEDGAQVKKRQRKQHRKKKKNYCRIEGCANWAVRGGVCVRHGAKVKLCSSEGCTNIVVKGGVCMRHGAKRKIKRCRIEGCGNQVQNGGVCTRHGAKRKIKLCSSEGCTNHAKRGGVCIKHGAKVTRKQRKQCSSEGCTNIAQRGGVCKKHGAQVTRKQCRIDGGTNVPEEAIILCQEIVEV